MNRDFSQRIVALGTIWVTALAALFATLYILFSTFGESWLLSPLCIAACSSLITGAVLVYAYKTARRDSQSVSVMTRALREAPRGEQPKSIVLDEISPGELRTLAEAINESMQRSTHDISDLKRLERVRSEFLGNVSHELRTPIFSVQGYLETLLDGAIDDPSVRDDFLKKAHHNVLRLHNLLTDLIEISRIESGEMKLSFRYFGINGFLHSVVEELRPTAEMAGVTLILQIDNHVDFDNVLGDRERLKQVLVNLIENAIKYNQPEGQVFVSAEFSETNATIKVRDTGIGIPAEHLGRIFERFYRVDKDRSRAVGGSGLGLAICKHIVEAHGSSIRVRSTPGEGTEFSFVLKR